MKLDMSIEMCIKIFRQNVERSESVYGDAKLDAGGSAEDGERGEVVGGKLVQTRDVETIGEARMGAGEAVHGGGGSR